MAAPTRMTARMIQEYRESGFWTQDTMACATDRHARERPHDVAMADARRRLGWAEVKLRSDALALGFLDLGLRRDDVVLAQLPNGVENLLVRLALKKAGLLAAFAPLMWRRTEMQRILGHLDARLVLAADEFQGFDYAQMLAQIQAQEAARDPGRTLVIAGSRVPPGATSLEALYERGARAQAGGARLEHAGFGPEEVSLLSLSSGSTGEPKVCEWPEGAQMLIARGIASRLGLGPSDVAGIFAPVGGGAGAMVWLVAALLGCRMVLSDSMAAEALLGLIERERVSFIGTVPAILIRMLECPGLAGRDLSSLRVVRTGTAALVPAVAREAEARLGCVIAPAYGSMETVSVAQAGRDDPTELRLGGSVGRPLPGIEVRFVDDAGLEVRPGEAGELWVRGPGTSSGYFRDPRATQQAWGERGSEGWYRTGDLACMDTQGNLSVLGRKKQVIVRGGNKIYPPEIESLLCRHPAVLEAAVLGVPHRLLGEVPWAFVIPRSGAAPAAREIEAFLCGSQIASYKLPERVFVVAEFPRLDSNKVDKRLLAQRYLSQQME